MANSSYTQQRLAGDFGFRMRVVAALSKVAFEVFEEPDNTPGHAARLTLAKGVVQNVEGYAAQISSWLVMRTNLISFETTYDFVAGAFVTAAGDLDIEAQIRADWNHLAGV